VPASAGGSGQTQTDGSRPGLASGSKKAAKPKALKLTAPDPTEDQFHESVAQLLWHVFQGKPVVWTTFPAGNYHLNPAAAGRLYRLGMKRGMPDVLIFWDSKTFGLELKTRKGRPSQIQVETHEELERAGVRCMVVRTLDEVLMFLRFHRIPMLNVKLSTEVRYGNKSAEGSGPQESPQGAGRAA
jgi:hypothetical protein